MPDFLLEIGSEETPSRFLESEERQLAELFEASLKEEGLPYQEIDTFSTPRRLAILIKGLAKEQETSCEILTGPPVRAAYDSDGKATAALRGFLAQHDAKLEQVFSQKNQKGEYVAIKKERGGRPAANILAEICPQILDKMSFPKKMRWGSGEQAWARPLHWLLALLDDGLVNFEFAGLASGRESVGHRVHGHGMQAVESAESWANELRNSDIEPSSSLRREKIIADGDKLAKSVNGKIIWKDSLLDEVCGLVEHAVPILGKFDPAYLELPAEVLLTSMEKHQKSFGVADASGNLLPYFLTVLNLTPKDMEVVRKGWERVLKARLEDARFFWRSDLATPMADWQAKLENVIFIGPLGSMAEKTQRLQKLASWLAERMNPALKESVVKAASLAKADLVSGMVGEFDSLQGIMGGIYAGKAGENAEVCQAIAEQYLPAGPDSPLPASEAGAMLALANNADTLVGCFGLGMVPGGMADPYGLRRSALAIIRILADRGWSLNLPEFFEYARSIYGDKKWKLSPDEAASKLRDFLKTRMRNYYMGQGYATTLVDAVLAREEDVKVSREKLAAMVDFAKSPNFEKLVQILKRAENILKKSGANLSRSPVRDDLLLEEAEKNLAHSLAWLEPKQASLFAQGRYSEALGSLEILLDPVNEFFEKVMVNCDDPALRENRLKLLRGINDLFAPMAAFNLLQV